VDIYLRAKEIRDGIVNLAFMAELDEETMTFRDDCARIGKTVAQVAEEISRAADAADDADDWTHAEAIAAWALLERP
jgi:DNA-binding ferritin-like protein